MRIKSSTSYIKYIPFVGYLPTSVCHISNAPIPGPSPLKIKITKKTLAYIWTYKPYNFLISLSQPTLAAPLLSHSHSLSSLTLKLYHRQPSLNLTAGPQAHHSFVLCTNATVSVWTRIWFPLFSSIFSWGKQTCYKHLGSVCCF